METAKIPSLETARRSTLCPATRLYRECIERSLAGHSEASKILEAIPGGCLERGEACGRGEGGGTEHCGWGGFRSISLRLSCVAMVCVAMGCGSALAQSEPSSQPNSQSNPPLNPPPQG